MGYSLSGCIIFYPLRRKWDNAAALNVRPFLSGRGDAIQRKFKFNSGLTTAETWRLRDCMPKVNWKFLISNWKCLLLHCEECWSVLYAVITLKFELFWIEFNNCPTRWDLFSLLDFCRQLYMFWVLTPIIRSSYNCNYSLWY